MGRKGSGVLWCRVHEVKLRLPLHQKILRWVIPYRLHGRADEGVDVGLWAGLGGVLHQELGVHAVLLVREGDVELVHRLDHRLCAFHQVLEYGGPVVVQLIVRVALQVNNLHLLHNCRLAALAGAWGFMLAAGSRLFHSYRKTSLTCGRKGVRGTHGQTGGLGHT